MYNALSEPKTPMSTSARGAKPAARESRGIQSIEVGGQLLLALAHMGCASPLKDLAAEAGMHPAKAHPYLVSFGKLGLIQQDAATGYYALGPLALQLGLISLHQVDPIRLATAALPRLAQALGHTVGIAIWGNRGPTFVRVEEGPTAVHVAMRHGTVVGVRATASGRLFAAFVPREKVLAALAHESGEGKPRIDARFDAELRRIRDQRFCALVDGAVKGVAALAVPVFDGFGNMVLALTAIGPAATLDPDPAGTPLRELMHCASDLSEQLGARSV
jgi:DNA-binding IclR family transcriptional regulator